MKVCSFTDCGREMYARDLCPGHYSAFQKGKALKPLRSHARRVVPKCSFDDCGRNRHANGLCSTHNRHRLQGMPLMPINRGKPCGVDSCGKEHVGRGYCQVHYNIWAAHKIDPAHYDRMHAQQGGVCAICLKKCTRHGDRLSVDHDHATGEIRGLLCVKCNLGIGYFHDNPASLRRAIAHLEANAERGKATLGHAALEKRSHRCPDAPRRYG